MKQLRERVILRDDDLSYFTDPVAIKQLYGSLWDRVPIHFAVIPKIYAHQIEAPQDTQHEKEYYSIPENKELVIFLKQKISEGKIKILQHGYTHRNASMLYELERSGVEMLVGELLEGKKILEETFQVPIDTIVAPHDRFSRDALLAIEKVGYQYVSRGFAPLPREINWRDMSCVRMYVTLAWYYLVHGRALRYPWRAQFGKHEEIFNYRIEGQTRTSINAIIKNAGDNGVIALTLHHRAFSAIQREMVHYLLDQIEKNDG